LDESYGPSFGAMLLKLMPCLCRVWRPAEDA